MSLRKTLFIKMVLVMLPLVAVGAWAGRAFDYDARVDALHDFVLARMENGGREECEADPERFPPRFNRRPDRRPPRLRGVDRPLPDRSQRPNGGPRPAGPPRGLPRIELFAYDATFRSANQHAPDFPADLRAALEAGATRADGRTQEGRVVHVAQRMAWTDGPCAVLCAWLPAGDASLSRAQLVPVLVFAAGMVLALWFAAGPIVGRVRRLTGAVRRAADEGYASPIPVEGRDELAQLATAFNDAGREVRANLESAQQREEALRLFVANTMHDVMMPLTVLQGHLSQRRDVADVGGAIEEVKYTTSLLQNLAAVAKLEGAGPTKHETDVDLGALVARVAGRHRPLARERSIELEFAVPEQAVLARCDLTLVEQAVSNLVHNAVRHNTVRQRAGDGHVAIVLTCNESQSEARFELEVLDDGPGIRSADLQHILERSWRSDEARTRAPDGQGLGLHIASEAARLHGFELTLREREGGGLIVRLTGPALGRRSPE